MGRADQVASDEGGAPAGTEVESEPGSAAGAGSVGKAALARGNKKGLKGDGRKAWVMETAGLDVRTDESRLRRLLSSEKEPRNTRNTRKSEEETSNVEPGEKFQSPSPNSKKDPRTKRQNQANFISVHPSAKART